MKKRNRFLIYVATALFAWTASVSDIETKRAGAGVDESIRPYYSAYIADDSAGTITRQDTVFDMTNYNGAGDKVVVTSEYAIENFKEGVEFCYPVMGTVEELKTVSITVNNKIVEPTICYGDVPHYMMGGATGFRDVQEAIRSVQPCEIVDGTGVLYIFEMSDEALTFSFKKGEGQTVFHGGSNIKKQSVDGYEITWNNNKELPYRMFATNGELSDFECNVAYTKEEITYKEYADYYLEELIAEMGEDYRAICYSRFNRCLDEGFMEWYDALYRFEYYSFALLKTTLPVGNVAVKINSFASPLVYSVQKPYVYILRAISPFSKEYPYTLQVKMSASLPYIIESNIVFKNYCHQSNSGLSDGYFVLSSKKSVDVLIDDKNQVEKRKGIIIASVGIFLFIGTFFLISKKKKISK